MRILSWVLRPVQSATALIWFRLLGQMPVPSESKWRGLQELLSLICEASIQADDDPDALYQPTVDQAMSYAGSKWMQSRSGWVRGSNATTPATTDLLVLAFKTLNMPTQIRRDEDTIVATTFRCPLVDQANSSKTARRICQVTCSEGRSLFNGMVNGLPIPVDYRAPRKMGWGHPVCIKEFHFAPPLKAHSEKSSTLGAAND